WHEIETWYGWESVKGVSEKESAFSPEDLYSNMLGIKIAVAIIRNKEARSRDDYDRAMDAWIRQALKRLAALSREGGRTGMKLLDGKWWDSSKSVPEWNLVTRRNLDFEPALSPWLVSDLLPEGKIEPGLRLACDRKPPPLPLDFAERLGGHAIGDLVSVDLL